MKEKILNSIRNLFQPKVIVLMYHRIANSESDIWDIAVSPENFERQLRVLQRTQRVISANELISKVNAGKIEKDYIVITFDDGYADNFYNAKPLLEKYKLPSSFFITSANISTKNEFWWDELEHLFLFSNELPALFSMSINGKLIEFSLGKENNLSYGLAQKHKAWKACDEPPFSVRSALFFKVWEELKPMRPAEQQQQMELIRRWAGSSATGRAEYRSMSEEQLRKLAENELFEIGAHTVNHAALAYHLKDFQKNELLENISFIEKVTGKEIDFLTYPYGNYNSETLNVVGELGLKAAFTTEEATVKKYAEKYRLGRLQVKNWKAEEFKNKLSSWSRL